LLSPKRKPTVVSTEIRIVHKDYVEAAKNITANQNQPGSDVLNNKLYNSGSHGVFQSNDEAATNWAQNVNPTSINVNLEYSSTLYEVNINGQQYTTYSEPAAGSLAHYVRLCWFVTNKLRTEKSNKNRKSHAMRGFYCLRSISFFSFLVT